ncbi:MAG: hypothetical protein IT195_02810 [Microthrixaceae bacterium]|nr:hypothetical protein [Microthrixaceae bacterium]
MASLFDRLQVGDDLRPTEITEQEWNARRSLARLGTVLDGQGHEDGSDAAARLRKLAELNNAFKHSTQRAGQAAAAVGLAFPVADWTVAWNFVAHSAVAAVRALTLALRRIADVRA